MKPKTLLISHQDPPGVDLFSDGGRCEPLPLTYLAAYLRKYHFPVEILDANLLGYSNRMVAKQVEKRNPTIVGLSATTANFLAAVDLAKKIKKLKNPPLTIIGGPHITAVPHEVQKHPCLDLAVIGEGEETLLEVLTELKKKKPNFQQVKGLAFRQGKKLSLTPPHPYIKNLDRLPFPARDLLPPLSAYHPTPGMYRRLPMAFMITSRGCPYHCVFCSRTVFGNFYRARSAKNVVDEMEHLVKNFGIKEIRVCDDLFNLKEKRVLEICREILRRKLDLSWGCSARANKITRRSLRAMKKAGCWEVCYGIESGNEQILKTIKKNLDLETIKKAVHLTREEGLDARGFFMFGLPGDTLATMQQTIDFSKKLGLSIANFYVTIPFPGTELARSGDRFGKIDKRHFKNYLNQTTTNPPFVPSGLNKFQVLKYYQQAYREFFLRPSYLFSMMLKIRSRTQLKAYFRALFSLASRFLK